MLITIIHQYRLESIANNELIFLLLLLISILPVRDKCRHHIRLRFLNFPQLHQPGKVQYSTVQYSRVQCSIVRYSAVQYSTVQYGTVEYSAVTVVDI